MTYKGAVCSLRVEFSAVVTGVKTKNKQTKKTQPLKYLQSPEGSNYQLIVMNPGHMLLRSKSGNIKHGSLIEACQIVTKSWASGRGKWKLRRKEIVEQKKQW